MVNKEIFRDRIIPILLCSALLPPATLGHSTRFSDDTIDIESDIKLRWLNEWTMQILWPEDIVEDTEQDQGLNNSNSATTVGPALDVVDEADDTVDMADTESTASDNRIEEDSSHHGSSSITVRPTLDVVDGAVDTEDMADTESTASDEEIEEDSSDDTHDLMFLTPSISFPLEENEKNCRFRGKLENHPRARASVVGCMGDDITFVNINLDGEFKVLRLTKDGKTWTKIPNPNIDTMVKVRGKRDTYFRPGFVDFLETTEEAPTVLASREGPPPKAITLPYTLGYDLSLKNFFRSDSKAKNYVKDAYVLAEPFLEDESNLGTEVHLKFGDIKYVDENVQADDMCGRQSSAVKRVINSQKGNLIPLVIFAEDKVDCTSGWSITSGCAFTSSACGTSTGTNIGIVDMGPVGRGCASRYPNNDVQGTAMTFVHEIGHMIGMDHDFPASRSNPGGRRDGKDCSGQGHMSYGQKPQKWSSCSITDFKNWWNGRGHTCKHVEHGTTNCGGHKAPTCKKCASSPSWCNGDCAWDYEARECANKEILRPSFEVGPGFYWVEEGGWNDGGYSHLKVISDSTVRECEEECVKIPECVGFTFEKRRDECELKEETQAVHLKSLNNQNLISGHVKLREGAAWVNNAGDYVATSRTVVYDIESSLECARYCEGKSGCVAWTYVANYNRCDVKDKDTAHHYTMKYSDVVSGIVIKRY